MVVFGIKWRRAYQNALSQRDIRSQGERAGSDKSAPGKSEDAERLTLERIENRRSVGEGSLGRYWAIRRWRRAATQLIKEDERPVFGEPANAFKQRSVFKAGTAVKRYQPRTPPDRSDKRRPLRRLDHSPKWWLHGWSPRTKGLFP